MRKRLWMAALTCIMTLALSMPVFAADWILDETGWWYQNDDGSYPTNGWTWINGKCYYFMPDGYCLTGTQTPDGYTVDESGAWTVDGVVQVQNSEQTENAQVSGTAVQVDGMTFTAPEGFVQDLKETSGFFFYKGTDAIIGYISESGSETGSSQELTHEMQKKRLDQAVINTYGTPNSSSSIQVPTGTWYRYDYTDAASIYNISGSAIVYTRIHGIKVQLMVFAGDLSGMDTDAIMSNNLK